jgi:hypothetical protein
VLALIKSMFHVQLALVGGIDQAGIGGPSTWFETQELPESDVLEYMREKGMLDY